MSRNEIRLRRKAMTTRRMESHKDYDSLMGNYRKVSWVRRSVRWILVLAVLLSAIFIFLYFA